MNVVSVILSEIFSADVKRKVIQVKYNFLFLKKTDFLLLTQTVNGHLKDMLEYFDAPRSLPWRILKQHKIPFVFGREQYSTIALTHQPAILYVLGLFTAISAEKLGPQCMH